MPSTEPGRRLTRQERLILLVLATVQFTSIVDFMVIMPLAPQLKRAMRRTPPAGSSSMAMTSVQATSGSPDVSPTWSGGPTSTTGMPSSATARRAPSTISPGDLSPPMASTATGRAASASVPGRSPRRLKSVDLDGLTPLVPPADRADDVRCLGGLAVGAHAAGRPAQHPVGGLAATPLGFGRLLLRDCHRGSPTIRLGAGASGRADPRGSATGAHRG